MKLIRACIKHALKTLQPNKTQGGKCRGSNTQIWICNLKMIAWMTSSAPGFSKGFTLGTQTLETLQLHSNQWNHHYYLVLQSNCIFPQFFISCLFTSPKRKAVCIVCFPHTHALLSPYSHILSLFIDLLDSFLLGFELWTFSALRMIVKVAATFTWVFGGYGLKTFKDFPRSKGQISHPLQLCGVSWGSTASTGSTGSWGRTTTSVVIS